MAPDGFDWRDTWYDVSPMRPDEFGRQLAGRWLRIEQIQTAWHKGRAAADAQAKRAEDIKRQDEAARQKLIQQHGG